MWIIEGFKPVRLSDGRVTMELTLNESLILQLTLDVLLNKSTFAEYQRELSRLASYLSWGLADVITTDDDDPNVFIIRLWRLPSKKHSVLKAVPLRTEYRITREEAEDLWTAGQCEMEEDFEENDENDDG